MAAVAGAESASYWESTTISPKELYNRAMKQTVGEFMSLADCDIVFIGGGQDFEQEVLLSDLHRGKDSEIIAAVNDGVSFLTICGGDQLHGGVAHCFTGDADTAEKNTFLSALRSESAELF